jgi:solute carrier family 13 (sodium-dependent dicarboxylate transporter), member 2/3/5
MSVRPIGVLEQESTVGQEKRNRVAGLAAAILTFCVLSLLPTPAGLSPDGQRMGALFGVLLVLWSTEALPIAVTAILALVLQPILGLNTLGAAFSNFISPVFFFVMVMFIIAYAWLKTGLAQRFALWMISKAGTNAKRVFYVFMFGTGAMSTIISDVPCAAIFMAVALGIFQKLKLEPGKSRFGKVVMIGIPIAALIGGVATPAGSAINLLGLFMIEQNGGVRIPFVHWMAIGMPVAIVMLPIAAWVLLRFYPPEIQTIGDIQEVQRDRKKLGPVSNGEWKVLVVMSTMLVFWILSSWFPAFDVTLVAVLGAVVMFLPGINLFTWKEVEAATGWEALLMIGGATSLGVVSAKSGLAKWLVDSTVGGFAEWNVIIIVALISTFIVVFHLVLPHNPTITAVVIPPIVLAATRAGHNPALYALPVVFTASCAFLLPLDAVPLVTYSKGYYRMVDMLLPGAVISVVWVIVITGLTLLIGPAIGLL